MQETEIAYAAGFFDGEGNITIQHGYPRVTISQVDRRPLEMFQAQFGGNIVRQRNSYNHSWNLVINGVKARQFLIAIRPYCTVKRTDINGVLGDEVAETSQ